MGILSTSEPQIHKNGVMLLSPCKSVLTQSDFSSEAFLTHLCTIQLYCYPPAPHSLPSTPGSDHQHAVCGLTDQCAVHTREQSPSQLKGSWVFWSLLCLVKQNRFLVSTQCLLNRQMSKTKTVLKSLCKFSVNNK